MIDHLSLQCADVDVATDFYLAVFAAHGVQVALEHQTPAGRQVGMSGPDGFSKLWLGPLVDDGHRPVHVALTAPDRAAVDAVHAAAQGRGAEVLHPPRVWPEYHDGYYSVFLRDPDGNNVESVHHTWPTRPD